MIAPVIPAYPHKATRESHSPTYYGLPVTRRPC